LVCHIEGGIWADSDLEQGAEEGIWAKGEQVTGYWRRLHNEELHYLYSSPNIILVKGKAIPLQAWRGAQVFRSVRLPDFNTIGT
jgi:hypothetical protein